MIQTADNKTREIWVDWMRVAACFLVMLVHSTEPFYFGGEGTLILTRTDALWASFFDSFARACVPLFVVASSYLQFPLHYSTGEFFRRRAVRILVPFIHMCGIGRCDCAAHPQGGQVDYGLKIRQY